ncbi:hypothetical protein R3W88_006050 [Solanum pinnatisectum]|uniref:Acylsugar acyltransferase 3-like n=1 Tax=Solanum pinnatisectum TaxID=50273 RepID=A0AAV9KHI2_9SOLN|nr:hypothetical protein R3W88_006050 [Solanum pinnatisectum]
MAFSLLSSPSLVSICDKSFIKPSSLTPSTHRFHKPSLVDQSFSHNTLATNIFIKNFSLLLSLRWKLRDNSTVDCNDMGAEFSSVRIKCHISEILDHPDASHAESIVFPKYAPWANNYEGDNLLVAQAVADPGFRVLSKFDCGEIAVSVCLSHKIGDGCSVINFLNDWSGLTRDHTTTTLINPSPRFVGDSIFSTQNYGPIIDERIVTDLNECVQKRLIFPTTKINHNTTAESEVENPTRAEVVSALLFKCATKTASSTTRTSKLVNYFNVATKEQDIEIPTLVRNLRKELFEVAYKKDQVEQNEFILEIVESIRKGKIAFDDENCTSMYFCSNLCKYPYYNVDFGWGKTCKSDSSSSALARCITHLPNGPFKNLFFFMDYQNGRGLEARIILKKQHMSEFELDEELLD